MSPRLRLTLLVLVAACVLLAPAQSAFAASATVSGGTLSYVSGNEVNTVTVTQSGSNYVISDPGIAITLANGTTVTGSASFPAAGVSALVVDSGASNDTITVSPSLRSTLLGGAGTDSITGGGGNDILNGGDGNDVLTGGAGTDTLYGGNDDDTLDGGTGADSLRGESGSDTASYATRTSAVAVTLDNAANDGSSEGDDVRTDIEKVLGGSGADTLTGTSGNEELNGAGGDDTLKATGGADTLIGGSGRDLADYSARTRALAISLDDNANDGESGEGDDVRSDVERVFGGSAPDTLAGSDADNELRGNDGADVLRGGLGADTFTGNGGDDTVDYSDHPGGVTADIDGVADDGTTGANERDNIGTDVDVIIGGDGADRLTGSAAVNTLNGGSGGDVLRGGDSADKLLGGEGDDDLGGDNGDDTLDGGTGADRLAGGSGSDLADYSGRGTGIDLTVDGAANDGESGERDNVVDDIEKLTGGAGDDHIAGGAIANTVTGGAGNDTLDGGGGGDTLAGGDGTDRADYGNRGGALTVDIDGSADDGESGERDNVKTDVEDILGGSGDDRLTGDGDANNLWGSGGNDTLRGGSGADAMSGGPGSDLADYSDRSRGVQVAIDGIANDGESGESDNVGGDVERVAGSGGDDRLQGDAADNVLTGNNGRDTILGGPGNDLVDGSAGDDTLQGGVGADRLAGGSGTDWADYSDRANGVGVKIDDQPGDGEPGENDAVDPDVENVRGGTGSDTLIGSNGRNALDGGDGDDLLDGAGGGDTIAGGAGADTADYSPRTAAVTVSLDGQGNDGQSGEGDKLAEDVESVRGGSGDDVIVGNDDPNRLNGGEGKDKINGGNGADVLIGLGGADKLDGNKGVDKYDAGDGNDVVDARDAGKDTVNCGKGTDTGLLDKKDKKPKSCEKRTLNGNGATSTSDPAPPADTGSGSGSKGSPVGVKTINGKGKIVGIPGFAGERVDRRLLTDIAWMKRKFHIRVTDGYALSGHAEGGEHPIGVAVDIVPGAGGSWNDIDKLAKWAEPRQNAPRAPFRWVGYNGDANHGRGNHLHLSWKHGAAKKGHPPKWVQVLAFKGSSPSGTTNIPSLERYAFTSNASLGKPPKVKTGLPTIKRCSGASPLKGSWKAAGKAFKIKWQIIAAITQIESGFGCNMGPSSAGAIGWTQFMPATWKIWGMDASGDGKADPYNSTDAIFSTARYLRASGAPGNYRKAIFAYNHADWYVNQVLALSKKFK